MILQLNQLRSGQLILLIEINLVRKDTVELRSIGALDGEHAVIKRLAKRERRHRMVLRSACDDIPHRIWRHNEWQRLLLHRLEALNRSSNGGTVGFRQHL